MEKEFRREQHYAVSKSGVLTHIKDAHNSTEDYCCPSCGCRMLKKCGSIRTWHFAHDWRDANELQKKCSYESYLHEYAKLRLKQWFEESDSIIFHYVQSVECKKYKDCEFMKEPTCRLNIEMSYDLKDVFKKCSIEAPVTESNGSYRADLLLTSEDGSKQILIEIKVSHGCTEKKKDSGARIIEFDVTSEEDVDYIISHDIKESDKVRYYGFDLIRNDEKGLIKPARRLRKFILFKSGKIFCEKTCCQDVENHRCTSLFEITTVNVSDEDCWRLTLYGLMKARERGFKYPSCFLCDHCYYNEESGRNECDINKIKIERGTDALNCVFYRFKPKVFEKISYWPIECLDIWSRSCKNK